MKLRLPHKFQAALMAAIASVSFTVPQAQASSAAELNTALEELLTLNNYVAGDDYTFSYTLTTVGTSNTGTILTLASGYYFNTQQGNYGGLSTSSSGVSGGWPVPTEYSGSGLNVWETTNSQLTGWISRDKNGTGTSAGTLSGSTITVKYSAASNTTTFELYHKNKQTTDRVIMTGVALGADGLSFGNWTSAGTDLVFRAGKDYVWNGTDGNATWNGDTGNINWLDGENAAPWTSTGNAMFTTSAAVKSVTIGENVTARNMAVQDNYTFVMGGNTVNVTAGMELASGKTLTLNGAGTLSAGAGITGGGNITKTGSGKLALNATVNLNTVSVQAGELSITGTADNKGIITSLRSYRGTTVELTNVTATAVNEAVPSGGADDKGLAGNLVIGSGATVNATKDDGWNFKATNKLTVAEGGLLDMKSIRWTFQNTNSIELAGGIITGQGNSTYGALDFNGANTITVTEDSTLSARVRLRTGALTFEVAKGKELAFSGGAVNQGNGGITKTGDGTLTISGAIPTSSPIVLSAGTLKVEGSGSLGTGTVTQNAGVLEIGNTVNLGARLTQNAGYISVLESGDLTLGGGTLAGTIQNAGAITLGGTITVKTSDISLYELKEQGTKTYSGTGTYQGSGYLTGDSSKYYLVKSSTGTVTTNALTLTGGAVLAESGENEVLFTYTPAATRTYYINSALAYNDGEMSGATGFEVAARTTFTASGANFNNRFLVLNEGSTLNNTATTYFNTKQISSLTLKGDASVAVAGGRIALQTGSDYRDVTLQLNGHTLTVKGNNGGYFGIVGNTTVDAGTIALQGPKFMLGHSDKGGLTVTAPDTLLTLTSGSSLVPANGNRFILEGLQMAAGDTGSASIASDGATGNLTLSPDAGKSYTYKGSVKLVDLTLDGPGTQVMNVTSYDTALTSLHVNQGTLKLTGANVTTGTLAGAAGGTLDVAGTLTVNSNAANDFAGTLKAGGLTKSGNGALTLHGISGLGSTITLNGGSLRFATGTYSLDGLTVVDEKVFDRSSTTGGANDYGYATVTKAAQVVSTMSGVTADEGVTFSVGTDIQGATLAADGRVRGAAQEDKTTFHLVGDTYVDLRQEQAANEDLTTIDVMSGYARIALEGGDAELQHLTVGAGAVACVTDSHKLTLTDAATFASNDSQLALGLGATLELKHAASVSDVLAHTTGAGDIILGVSATFSGSKSTQATGKLTIGSDVTLTIGEHDTESNNLSSLSSVELDGGTLKWNSGGIATGASVATSLKNLTTTNAGGTFQIYDINGDPIVLGGTTSLQGDLELVNQNWGEKMTIEKLSGVGSLNATSTTAENALVLTIGSITGYTGGISIVNPATTLNATLDSGVSMASLTTTGTVNLTVNEDAAITGAASFGDGTLTITGAGLLTMGGLDGTGTISAARLALNVVGEDEQHTFDGIANIGILTMDGAGGQTIGGTVTPTDTWVLNGGHLTLTGDIYLDSMSSTARVARYEGGVVDGVNGFASLSAFNLVQVASGASVQAGEGTTFHYGEHETSTIAEDGQVSFDGLDTEYSTFYILADGPEGEVETLSNARTAAGEYAGEFVNIVMSGGTTLNADAGDSLTALTVSGGSTDAARIIEQGEQGYTPTTLAIGTVTLGVGHSLTVQDKSLNITSAVLDERASLEIGNAATASISGATMGVGASLSVTGTGKVVLNNSEGAPGLLTTLTGDGTIELTADATMANGSSSAATGTLLVNGATLQLGTSDQYTTSISSFDKVVLDGGQITYNTIATKLNNLTVDTGKTGTLRVEDMDRTTASGGTSTILLDGVTSVGGTLVVNNHYNSNITIAQLAGAGTLDVQERSGAGAEDMTLTINSLSGFTGDIKIVRGADSRDSFSINTGSQEVSFNSLALDLNGHTLNFTLDADAAIGALSINNGSVAFAGTGNLALNGLAGSGSLSLGQRDLTVNVAEGADQAFDGSLSLGGTLVKDGAGALALNGTGNVISSTIDLQSGSLALNGTFDLSGISHGTAYYGGETGNGFRSISDIQLVDVTGGTLSQGTGASFLVDNVSGTLNTDSSSEKYGVLSFDKDYTTFHVNNGSTDYVSNAAKVPEGTPFPAISLSSGSTLVADTASVTLSTDGISLASGASATLQINSGVTVNAGSTNKSLTLTGEGTYMLVPGVLDLKGATLDATSWTGIVMVNSYAPTSTVINFSAYAKANSYVGLSGVSGVDAKWSGSETNMETLNFYLVDKEDGTAAWNWNDGSYQGATMYFAGKMAGSGTLQKTKEGVYNNFVFTNDVSAWTGKYLLSKANAASTVTFKDGAKDVAVSIENESNQALNVVFSNSNDVTMSGDVKKTGTGALNVTVGANTTFSRIVEEEQASSVSATDLTVNAGKSATFNGKLNVSGNATLNNGSAMSFGEGSSASIANTKVAASARATVNGADDASVDFGNVNVGASAELNVMNLGGAASVSVSDVTLGTGAIMGVYNGENVQIDTNSEGKLTIQTNKVLTAGQGATLNANLELATGSTLDVSASNGVGGLLMGSSVTLNEGMQLSDNVLSSAAWTSMEFGDTYDLFSGVDSLNIVLPTDWQGPDAWVDASRYFTNLEEDKYFLFYTGSDAAKNAATYVTVNDGSNVGVVYIASLPEPTTGTLSLLALAALAARRRRK